MNVFASEIIRSNIWYSYYKILEEKGSPAAAKVQKYVEELMDIELEWLL